MRTYSLFLVPLVLFLLLQSCAPAPVFRMKPNAKHTTFYEGTEYVHKREGGVQFTISYNHHYGGQFAMAVEIVNHTDSVLRIKPSQFWYDAYKYYDGTPTPDSILIIAKRRALNPEKEILDKDLAISRSRAQQKTSNLLYGVGQVLTLASSFNDSTQAQRFETQSLLQSNAAFHAAGNHQKVLHRRSLRSQRKFWRLNTLRTTDLLPDEYIHGLVFFKNEPDAGGYMIHYKIGDVQFNVFFNQKKFKP